ncbi:MAG: DUF4123 domain-containing protein [Morganella sp. (in: enterobacteria)]
MAKSETCYAVIDAASEPDVFSLLDKYNPPACCLYSEPLQPDIAELAPYLVEVTEEVRKWLNARQTPWGIYIYATASMRELRHHLRKFTMVVIPGQEKPVFWRFYDPRNIWEILATFDNWRLHTFLGPVTKLETTLWGNKKSDRFEEQREQYPEQANMSGMFLKFSQQQHDDISRIFISKYVEKIAVFLSRDVMYLNNLIRTEYTIAGNLSQVIENNKFDLVSERKYIPSAMYDKSKETAKNLVAFLMANDIRDINSIGYIAYLFAYRKIVDFDAVPAEWNDILTQTGQPGYYKVNSLMLKEFGQVPAIYKG